MEFDFKVDGCMTVQAKSKREAERKARDILARANCFSSYIINHDPR